MLQWGVDRIFIPFCGVDIQAILYVLCMLETLLINTVGQRGMWSLDIVGHPQLFSGMLCFVFLLCPFPLRFSFQGKCGFTHKGEQTTKVMK